MNTTKALMNNLIELLDSLNIHNTNKDETKLIIKSIFDKKIKNKKYNKSQHTHYGSEGILVIIHNLEQMFHSGILFLMKNTKDMMCKMMCKSRSYCISYLYNLIFF